MFNAKKKLVELLNLIDRPGAYVIDKRDAIEELYNHLRVCVKYLLFEREALRRERDYFRSQLKEKE